MHVIELTRVLTERVWHGGWRAIARLLEWLIAKYPINYIACYLLFALLNHEKFGSWLLAINMYLPVIAIHFFTSKHPTLLAWLIVHRRHCAAVFLVFVCGAWLSADGLSRLRAEGAGSLETWLRFIAVGGTVGFVFRMLVRTALQRVIFGLGIEQQQALLLIAVTAFGLLLPLSPLQESALAPYVIGFVLGGTVDFILRLLRRRRARVERFGHHLAYLMADNMSGLSQADKRYARLLVDGRTSELRVALGKKRIADESLRTIIEATIARHSGDYSGALRVIRSALAGADSDMRTEWQLLESINFHDAGLEPDAEASLRQALWQRPAWDLGRLTRALRAAERVAVDRCDETGPLNEAWDAINRLASLRWSAENADMMGGKPTYVWTFAQDVYGYCLLKAGRFRLARQLLAGCLLRDPDFSSVYLHLGELFLADSFQERALRGGKVASRVCLSVALGLEGSRRSSIFRRARVLMDSLSKET